MSHWPGDHVMGSDRSEVCIPILLYLSSMLLEGMRDWGKVDAPAPPIALGERVLNISPKPCAAYIFFPPPGVRVRGQGMHIGDGNRNLLTIIV